MASLIGKIEFIPQGKSEYLIHPLGVTLKWRHCDLPQGRYFPIPLGEGYNLIFCSKYYRDETIRKIEKQAQELQAEGKLFVGGYGCVGLDPEASPDPSETKSEQER